MKHLNRYFFLIEEGEKLHPSDAFWFYGGLSFFVAVTFMVVL